MTTVEATDAAGVVLPRAPVAVVWWRAEHLDVEVPRRHGVGWALPDGRDHGHLALRSDPLHLRHEQIEEQLVVELGPQLGELQLNSARSQWADVVPAVRILAGGARIADLDLHRHYGDDALAGITCEIRGRGIAARAVFDTSLTTHQRTALLKWAETQIHTFPALSASDLVERGWRQTRPSRWQLLAYNC